MSKFDLENKNHRRIKGGGFGCNQDSVLRDCPSADGNNFTLGCFDKKGYEAVGVVSGLVGGES